VSAIPAAYLLCSILFDETSAQPYIFAVADSANLEPSVFYFPVSTRCRIFCSYGLLCLSDECCFAPFS